MTSFYSFLEDEVPKTITRYGHKWEITNPDGKPGDRSATRNKKQAESEANMYMHRVRVLPRYEGGFWRWKAIIVPHVAKIGRPGWHNKGEKFYLVYIRKYVSKS
jgi:hypothetical protein